MEGGPQTSYIVVEGQLYRVGGRYRGIGKFYVYDVDQNEWNLLPTMKTLRYNCLLVHLDGFIYAIGGIDSHTDTRSDAMECFDIVKKEWTTVAAVPKTPSCVSAYLVFQPVCIKVKSCCTIDLKLAGLDILVLPGYMIILNFTVNM